MKEKYKIRYYNTAGKEIVYTTSSFYCYETKVEFTDFYTKKHFILVGNFIVEEL